MDGAFDKLGRRTRRNRSIDRSINSTPLIRAAWPFIRRHRLVNSHYIKEYLKLTEDAKPRAIARLLTIMRAGGFLDIPADHLVENPAYRSFIYGTGERLVEDMLDHGQDPVTIGPLRNMRHDYATAVLTASLELSFIKHGIEYKPATFFLERAQTTHGYQLRSDHTYYSDNLFGAVYPGGDQRLFVVETDMGTEQKSRSTKTKRKSYDTMIDDLAAYVDGGGYKDHLKVRNTPMKALVVFAKRSNELTFHQLLAQRTKKCDYIFTRTIEGIKPYLLPAPPDETFFSEGFNRLNSPQPFLLNRP